MKTRKDKTPDEIFEEFWKDIVCNEDGSIDVDQLKKELYDFYIAMEEVPKVYCHITGNRLSYITYNADTVINCVEEYQEDRYNDGYGDGKKDSEDGEFEKAFLDLLGLCIHCADFRNGNEAFGVDEGNVGARDIMNKLTQKLYKMNHYETWKKYGDKK